jgi:nitrite reductase (NADH) small subunit/3-phenylpropionate/trans-cinnamate dioxygenase ferredoxin subunit
MSGMSEGYAKVGQIGDFPAGALKKVTISGEDVVVSNIGGQLYAIADKCTHRGGPLSEGELEGTTVTCPWHGGQFDMTNGVVVQPPPMTNEASYEVKVEASNVFLKKK